MSLIESVRCAATVVDQSGRRSPCQRAGTFICGRCNLAIYCDRQHRDSDLRRHEVLCKDPIGSVNWEPDYVIKKKIPTILWSPVLFGGSHCVWGSPAAVDFLNLGQNEGLDASTTSMDFSVCFAASSDIRNLVETVNHLPSDHRGNCRFLINDIDPFVYHRNLGILLLLLKDDMPIEEASEAAVHLMYSVGLTPKIAQWWEDTMPGMFPVYNGSNRSPSTHRTRGVGTIEAHTPPSPVAGIYGVATTSYNLTQARSAMHRATCSPSRHDHVEAYLFFLTHSHRLAFKWQRDSGMLLPFGSSLDAFTEPNRTLFDHSANWLGNDISDPLHGWPAGAVLSSGAKYGVPKADWYGSLFYHVKAQFIEFARRVRDMNITIHVTAYDARDLAKMIAMDGLFPSFKSGFDRIDTSNLADHNHLGISAVVKDWGKLLRQTNPRATLSLQFINWGFQQNGVSPDLDKLIDVAFVYAFNTAMLSYGRSKKFARRASRLAISGAGLFYDHSLAFERYIKKQGLEPLAKRAGLVRKLRHSIIPKRKGHSLDQQGWMFVPVPEALTIYGLDFVEGGLWSDHTLELTIGPPGVEDDESMIFPVGLCLAFAAALLGWYLYRLN